MSEEPRAAAPKAAAVPKKKKKTRRCVLAIVIAVLLIAAVTGYIFREALPTDRLRGLLKQSTPAADDTEPFTYESGTDQVFATVGNGLAVASGSAVQLLNDAGITVWKKIVSYDTPAVFGGKERALLCDIGGNSVVVVTVAGESTPLETEGSLLSASMNGSGWFALVSETAGYKSLVQVYNDACELQYEWRSGSGYVLRTAVSPDNRVLAALCADSEGGVLHLLSLDSTDAMAETTFPDELLFDLAFSDANTLCCISQSALHFVRTDGTERGAYFLGEYNLLDYDLGGDGFAAVYASAYRAGTGGTVMTVSSAGKLLGSAEMSRNVVSMSARGDRLLVMTGGDLSLYGRDMDLKDREEALMTAKRALLRPDGKIYLLSAYAAEQFRF